MRILLVEDDIETSDMLKDFLITENFEVVTAYDGKSACKKFLEDKYSLVLLDIMIPGINGIEVMKIIRKSSTVPIIIISAKDSDSDKTLGLGLGADDYITKPFSVIEVLARIKANIRRNTQYIPDIPNKENILKKGNISVQGATNDIKKCFRYAEWKSQIFHSIFTYSLVALIDEIKPSVAFLLSSKLIFSQSSR